MNIEIEIGVQGIIVLATVIIDGAKMLTLPFKSIEDAEKWAESCKPVLERMAKECDCPKCRAEKEAEATKPEVPKPTWTPEVGMLIQSEQYGLLEITGILTGGASLERVSDRLRVNLSNCKLVKYRPIAELEGLKEGSDIFCVSSDGGIETFKIDSTVLSLYGVKLGDTWFRVNMDGKPKMFGNGKQMFWRTKERAERFGK